MDMTQAKDEAAVLSHKVVSPEEWLAARRDLLKEEKEESKRRDEFRERQRALPWIKVKKSYVFTTPDGDVSLSDLFGNHSQLFIKHFMMGPGQSHFKIAPRDGKGSRRPSLRA